MVTSKTSVTLALMVMKYVPMLNSVLMACVFLSSPFATRPNMHRREAARTPSAHVRVAGALAAGGPRFVVHEGMHAGHVDGKLPQPSQSSSAPFRSTFVGSNDDVILRALHRIHPQTPTWDAVVVHVGRCGARGSLCHPQFPGQERARTCFCKSAAKEGIRGTVHALEKPC